MFCHHHDEAEVFGADPVPCPFCGYGGTQTPDETQSEPGFEDSNDALRHALFDTEPKSDASELNTYW